MLRAMVVFFQTSTQRITGEYNFDEEGRDRVGALRRHLAPHEVVHQHRHQGDGNHGRAHHGEGLGEGQRMEQFPFLSLQHKDRHKGEHDDRQGEEDRPTDLLG